MPNTNSTSGKFSVVDFENMGSLVYGKLCTALMKGSLKPDERLKIRELAQMMGTSVTPVRDAVLKLVQDGVLVMHGPRNIRVRRISLKEYIEIRDIRVELEGMAAEAAALKASKADIRHLEDIVRRHESAIKDRNISESISINQEFHFAYCTIADMPLLLDILQGLWLKMGPLISSSYQGGRSEMVDHHYELIQTIRKHDSIGARNTVEQDIFDGGKDILEMLMSDFEHGREAGMLE